MNDYQKPYRDTSKQLQAQLKRTQKTMEKSLLKADKMEQKKSKLVKEYKQFLENWLDTLQKIPNFLRSHSSKLKDARAEYKVKSWDNWWKPVFLARIEIIFLHIEVWINIILYIIKTFIYSVLRFFYRNSLLIFAVIMLILFMIMFFLLM